MAIEKYITISDLLVLVPISRSTVYRLMRENKFPQCHKLPESMGDIWSEKEVLGWLDTLPKSKSKKKR